MAHEFTYDVVLNGLSESPANASRGAGIGTVTLDLDIITMAVDLDFSGLTGVTTSLQIHCCTTTPLRAPGNSIAKAEALGCRKLVGPIRIPTGSFAWIADPDGNMIGLLKPFPTKLPA